MRRMVLYTSLLLLSFGFLILLIYPDEPSTINPCKNDYEVSTRLKKLQSIHTRYMQLRYAPSFVRRMPPNQALPFTFQSPAIEN